MAKLGASIRLLLEWKEKGIKGEREKEDPIVVNPV